MKRGQLLLRALMVAALTCAVPAAVMPVAAQTTDQTNATKAKKHIKKAGKKSKAAGEAAAGAAKDTGKAAAEGTKAGAEKLKQIAKDKAPGNVTAQCGDGTWSKASTRASACNDHRGVTAVVCPGALCQ